MTGADLRPRSEGDYLDVKALSAYSGIPERTLRDYANRKDAKRLPSFKPFGKRLFRRSEFDEWMERFRDTYDPEALRRVARAAVERLRSARSA